MSAPQPAFLPPVLRPPLPVDEVGGGKLTVGNDRMGAGGENLGAAEDRLGAGGRSAAQPPAALPTPSLSPIEPTRNGGPASLDPSHQLSSRSKPSQLAALAPHAVMLLAASSVVLLAALLEIHEGVAVKLFGFTVPEMCSWRRVWGIDCMGCGLTRSFISLAHLDPFRAWGFNPAGPVLFAGVIYQIPYRLGQLWRVRRSLPTWSAPVFLYLGWISLSVFALLAQWTIRTAWPMWISQG